MNSAPAASAITVRPATEDDYPAAVRLFRAMMGETFELDAALWKAACTAPDRYSILVATENDTEGDAVGLAVVVVSDRIRLASGTRRTRYHLDQLIVAPEKRQRGIGRALLDQVIALARQSAPSYILVNCDFTNVAARRTYEAAGLNLVRQAHDRFEIAFS